MIRDFVKIFPRDKIVHHQCDFVRCKITLSPSFEKLFLRDNPTSINRNGFIFTRFDNFSFSEKDFHDYIRDQGGEDVDFEPKPITYKKKKNIILKIDTIYEGNILNIGQLKAFAGQYLFSFYGKGIFFLQSIGKLSEFLQTMQKICLNPDVTITRLDECIDIEDGTLRRKLIGKPRKQVYYKNPQTGDLETVYHGSKRSDYFIRMYDKKVDLARTGHERLYPYDKYKSVIRYELVINRGAIPEKRKETTVTGLAEIIETMNKESKHKRYRPPGKRKLEMSLQEIKRQIKTRHVTGDIEKIESIQDFISILH